MAYLFNGATHIISRSDAVLQSWPITLHGRIRLTNPGDGLDHTIVGLWEAGSNNGFRLQVEFPGSLTKARCGTKAGGTAANATTTTTITDTNWHSVVGEITSASARQVWLDNGGNGSSSTSLTPGTLTKTTAGAYDNGGTLGGNVAHELADVAVWSVALTSDERASLAAGVSPLLIRPDKLEIYLPLMRGGNDYMGGAFTVTGATVADHPRVYMPSRAQQLVKTAASTGINGTASITEAGDTAAAVGTVALAAAASITESADTVSSTSTLAIAAALASTEAGDTASSASTLALAGAANIAEAGDTSSSTSTLAIAAALAATEAGDTSSVTGTLAIVGAAAITEAGDTVSASGVGVVSISGTASITEADDTAASVSTLKIAGASAITEAGDTTASTGALAINGQLAANDNDDTVSATATIGDGVATIRTTGLRPTDGSSTLRLNLSGGSRPSAISRGAR